MKRRGHTPEQTRPQAAGIRLLVREGIELPEVMKFLKVSDATL